VKLVIANKNYSSWSLRSWLLLRHADIAFEEVKLGFNDPAFSAKAHRYSPTGRLPVLLDGDLAIWDSLAIAEYVAERFPAKQLWPVEPAARARARSLCAEMHAGFAALRTHMPFNCELRVSNVLLDNATRHDIARIIAMWTECRTAHAAGGPFLFGQFTITDAYYAPVALRFVSYGTPLPDVARAYVATVTALPAMQDWLAEAATERDFFADDEPYREAPGRD
jgi:glutathione S-transferase